MSASGSIAPLPLSRPRSDSGALWRTPPAIPAWAAGTIDLWLLPVPVHQEVLAGNSEILSPEERDRAGRFHRPQDRACAIASNAALRRLLGGYLSTDPSSLRFDRGSHGKPRLAGATAPPLHFNLSHSSGRILIAAAPFEIGVDLEAVRPFADCASVARRFFSPDETRRLLAVDGNERDPLFFRIWTMKEAVLKLTGSGISGGLERFTVPEARGGDVTGPVSWTDPDDALGRTWRDASVFSFLAGPGIPAAAAWHGREPAFRFFNGQALLAEDTHSRTEFTP